MEAEKVYRDENFVGRLELLLSNGPEASVHLYIWNNGEHGYDEFTAREIIEKLKDILSDAGLTHFLDTEELMRIRLRFSTLQCPRKDIYRNAIECEDDEFYIKKEENAVCAIERRLHIILEDYGLLPYEEDDDDGS